MREFASVAINSPLTVIAREEGEPTEIHIEDFL
jgi:hypothetical protein